MNCGLNLAHLLNMIVNIRQFYLVIDLFNSYIFKYMQDKIILLLDAEAEK